ncbi:MFS transporter [Chitinophaga sp. MD30]|nr:MFS transporter [Chitinophaga sp. MD30]
MASIIANFISSRKKVKKQYRDISKILAFSLLPLSGFTTDIYVPSLPDMAAALHTGNLQVQLTLTLFLVSYGVGQLLIGGIMDSYGRYWISLVSLIIYALSSLAIALSNNIYFIDVMRVIQGLTVSAIIIGKRAFFVDLYTGEKLRHYLSLFSIIWSLGPILAPFIGGYLQMAFNWSANFYVLAITATIMVVLELIFSGETLKKPKVFDLSKVTKAYGSMLRSPPFTFGVLIVGTAYSITMIYNMTGPFIIEHHFGLSAVTAGYASLVLGFAWLCGGLAGRITREMPFRSKLTWSNNLQLLLVTFMIFTTVLLDNSYFLLCFAFLIQVCAGYIFNNLLTHCMGMFPENAGIAIGLAGGLNLITVSILSYGVVELLPARDGLNLGLSYLVFAAISLMARWCIKDNRNK